jgi:DNA-binding Xre family transcriptional regulator
LTIDFDVNALYTALDVQRHARRLTWAELAGVLGVSRSTISTMRSRPRLETDGILQMCRWLDRSLESFCPGIGSAPSPPDSWRLPGRIVRLDTRALHAALDAERSRRGLTLTQLATELSRSHPISAATLRNLARGPRVELNTMLAVTRYLNAEVSAFTHLTEH